MLPQVSSTRLSVRNLPPQIDEVLPDMRPEMRPETRPQDAPGMRPGCARDAPGGAALLHTRVTAVKRPLFSLHTFYVPSPPFMHTTRTNCAM